MDWSKSSMEAFRDGYLREMSLGVSVNAHDPDDLSEVYKFSFDQSGASGQLLIFLLFYLP